LDQFGADSGRGLVGFGHCLVRVGFYLDLGQVWLGGGRRSCAARLAAAFTSAFISARPKAAAAAALGGRGGGRDYTAPDPLSFVRTLTTSITG